MSVQASKWMTVIPMPYATTPMDPTFVAVVVDIREMVEAAMASLLPSYFLLTAN